MRSIFLILILCAISNCSCFTPIVDDKTSSLDYRRNRPRTITQRVSTNLSSLERCGRRQIEQQGVILSGSPTKPGDWPWHIAIFRLNSNGKSYICGGTLVSNSHVITAGHCVVFTDGKAKVNPKTLLVSLGIHNRDTPDWYTINREVSKITLHQDYTPNTYENDIAILKLENPVNFTYHIYPICLWKNATKGNNLDIVNKMGTVVGWGLNEKGIHPKELTKISIPVIDNEKCRNSNNQYAMYLNGMTFCAGYTNGTSVCNGDSGGGFYISETIEDGSETIKSQWFLRGIVSSIKKSDNQNICATNQYAIFTDAAKYQDFIESNL